MKNNTADFKKLLFLSSVMYFIYSAGFFGLLSIILKWQNLQNTLSDEKYISVLPVLMGFVFNMFLYLVLKSEIKKILKEEKAGKNTGFIINNYGILTGTVFITALLSNFAVLSFALFRNGIYISVIQSVFTGSMALILSLSLAMLFYCYSKKQLYVFSKKVKFDPLTLFAKFSVPVLTTVFLILIAAASMIFRVTYDNIYEKNMNSLREKADQISVYISNYFKASEIESYALIRNRMFDRDSIDIKDMEMTDYLNSIFKKKYLDYLVAYYIVDPDGNAVYNSNSYKSLYNSSNFSKMIVQRVKTLTSLKYNKEYGTETMESLIPIVRGDELVGGLGSVLKVDELKNILNDTKISKSSEIWLIDSRGEIVYHPEVDIVGKNLTNSFTTDEYKYVSKIQSTPRNVLRSCVFKGVEKYFYKVYLPSIDYTAVFVFDKTDITDKLNVLPVQIMLSILLIGTFLFFLIWRITKSFSAPIKKTITVLERLTMGDLTQHVDIYQPDEFGVFLHHFSQFQNEISKVITIVQDSSRQLSSAADNLASTTVVLSDSAQNQAAAVEESSASLEEVAGSVELIADSAKEQSELTEEAYKSLKLMNDSTLQVAESAKHSFDLSNKMTDEVKSGFSMMQSTREKMNEIKKSTNEISEIIQLIQDISDQVNLLSLNAAIEAARAGDHGKGFAVVASEITKLADRTAESAGSIRELVEKGLAEVKNGSDFVDSTTKSLESIVKNIEITNMNIEKITEYSDKQQKLSSDVIGKMEIVKAMAENISFSTDEQKMANKEMVHTIEGINEITQSVANGADNISSSITEISAQAESLKHQIGFFKVN